ncbi:MAG: ABC transporter substrate-binding protein [Marinibacterium sp.]|nr:ABC transporter substrate-binding protein [Marinibacterium sp.]
MLRLLTFVVCVFAPALAGAQAFPVEIPHAFGTARIETKPERIVSLSFIGHDFLLALDEVPHALRKWYGTDPYGVWPWAQDELGGATPVVLRGEIDVEQIAALDPDLIVGQWSGMSARDHALLSRIAPTIGPQAGAGDYGMSWQDMLRVLGRATGKSTRADEIIARLDARFADLRAAHPDWQGASAAVVWAGQIGAYTNRDIRGQFLERLGFRIPQAINDRGTLDNFYVLIPPEDLSPIDVDALIWIDAGGSLPALHRMPLRPLMRAHREGREIYADPTLSAALSHSSPLSLDYALDRLEPLLAAATDGDPDTRVTSSAEAGILPQEGTP